MTDDLLKRDVPPERTPVTETSSADAGQAPEEARSGEEDVRPDQQFCLTPPA